MRFFRKAKIFLVLLVPLIVFFKEIISLQKYFFEDALYLWYPYMNYLATSLREGHIPFWTPYIFSGMPFYPDVQTFYPLNWLFGLFIVEGKLPFFIVEYLLLFHLLLAGIFTYIYTRELKIGPIPSLVSAITFMLSGFLVCRTIHPTIVYTIVWLPLILFFLHRALTQNKWKYSIFAGIFLGISMLAGFPQTALHIFYVIALYIILYALCYKRQINIKKKRYYLVVFFVVLLVGIGIAAIQYLPSYVHLQYTLRESMTYTESTTRSLHPLQLITLFVPKFFGSQTGMATDSVPRWIGEYGHYWETCMYMGILPLLLAIIALIRRREKIVWFYGIVAGISLLLMLGKYTPIYKVAFYVLPGLNLFKTPGRFSAIFTFSIAILAGFGVEGLFGKKKLKNHRLIKGILLFFLIYFIFYILFISGIFKKPLVSLFMQWTEPRFRHPELANMAYNNIIKQYGISLIFIILSVVTIFLVLQRKIKKNIAAVIIPILIFVDLYTFGHNFNASDINPDEFYKVTPLVEYLQREREKEPFRINARQDGYMIFRRNSGDIYRLELLEGYTPLRLKRYAEFDIPLERKLDLLNVKYRIKVDEENRKMGLVENEDRQARAFMVYDYVLAKDKRVLETLKDEGFDYRNKVVLEEKPDKFIPESLTSPEWNIEIETLEPNRIELNVMTSIPGILVLSEIYYPAWKAYIDGKETKVYCADYVLRAICIERGKHRIEFVYDSLSFKIGAIISVITFIFVILGISLKGRLRFGAKRNPFTG